MKSTKPVKMEQHHPKHILKTLLSVLSVSLVLLLAEHAQAAPKSAKITKISSVPYNITLPGSYIVTEDLPCSGCQAAITIAASNVDLDLDGHTLSGDGSGVG